MKKMNLRNIITYIRSNFWLLFRYGVSGIAGILANLVMFSIAVTQFGVWYIFASLIGFVAAYIVTFSMHKWWTFAETGKERTVFQSILYLVSAVGTLLVNTAFLYVFVELVGLVPVFGQLISLGVSAILSFLFTSQITFHADEKRWNKITDILKKKYVGRWWFYPVILLFFLFLLASIRIVYIPITFPSDAVGYVATAQFIAGDRGHFEGSRFLKPLAPAVVLSISSFSGYDYETSLLIQAFWGYLLLGLAAYSLGTFFWNDKKAGFLLGAIVGTTYPILKYGLDNYIETGAWALYFLALTSILLWYKKPSAEWLWIASILLLLGLLWKEYAVLAGLVLGLAIVFQPILSIEEKLHAIAQGLSLTILPWAIWQAYVYKVYEYSYLDWLSMGTSEEFYQATYTLGAILKSTTGLLLFVWIFVLIGILKFHQMSATQKHFLVFLLIPSFGFLAWGWVSTRLFFSLVPLAALLAVHGLRSLFSFRQQLLVVLFVAIINIVVVWFSFSPDIRAILNDFAYDYPATTESE